MKNKIKYYIILGMLFLATPFSVMATTDPIPITDPTCENLLGETTTSYLTTALTITQIVGVLLAIILGMVDFLGAVWSGDADTTKKATKKVIIRIAMAAVLVIVPVLLKFVLNTFGVTNGNFCIL